ncbi:MAG TPA: TraB/GumN family protein, partial [Bryobacteraceae bacterium]|nr:TraB/GumN family protein [Bryobacteraceae bacterium]
MAANGMYGEGDELWKHVSEHTRELLTRFCEAHGFSTAVLARLKPWAASLTLSTLLMQSAGFQADLGIDMHFLKQAAGSKRVEQLETIEQQLRMLAEGSAAEQERALAEAAGKPEEATDLAARLKSAWISGDGKAVDELMSAALEKTPESGKRLLGDRNPHMAAEVIRYLRGSEPYFVVVGAGHLVGTDGIVNTVRKHGFTVTQVLASNE